jgi:hypothetical protein
LSYGSPGLAPTAIRLAFYATRQPEQTMRSGLELAKDDRKSAHTSDRFRYEPTGLLELRISRGYGWSVPSWTAGKVRKLEDRLNDVIIGMLVVIEDSIRPPRTSVRSRFF